MFAVTGDTHGEEGRFWYVEEPNEKYLKQGDYFFICGDFGYLYEDTQKERDFLDYLAKKPYTICFVDGNHENFDALNSYPVEEWKGGKVHILARDESSYPKVIHLMRGQIFEIEEKKIFVMGGGYSIDKNNRVPHRSWWPQEMPEAAEYEEAWENLKKADYKVNYILTHAAPEDTMNYFYPDHKEEQQLNFFLEDVRQKVEYDYWYFGHLHEDKDFFIRRQCALLFSVRNMENNDVL